VSASLCVRLLVCALLDSVRCMLTRRGEQESHGGLTRVCLSVPGGLSETLPRRTVLLSECSSAALTANSL